MTTHVGFEHYHYRCKDHPGLGYICGKVLHEHLQTFHKGKAMGGSPWLTPPHK